MPDYAQIYRSQAAAYQQLVSYEDCRNELWPAIAKICSPDGRDVVELGTGTGRLTVPLAARAKEVTALDHSAHMLGVAQDRLETAGGRWSLAVADNRCLPLTDECADLVIAGWTLGHLTGWYTENWQEESEAALLEMHRVARPAGCLIILETLGTGTERPAAPNEALRAFYEWLEKAWGMNRTWIRTDYHFPDVPTAERLTRFFFGDDLADRVAKQCIQTLPECTGLWCKTVNAGQVDF
jgi:ubiquinone/menaquinone biosynthesis C-methylase UbiE